MSNEKRISESTVARIAGNLLGSILHKPMDSDAMIDAAHEAVTLARAIVAEVKRTAAKEP